MPRRIVLAGAARTPIGRFGGALASLSAPDLAACAISAALTRARVPADAIDQVIVGCVLQAGAGQNVARQSALAAGLGVPVPALTVNQVCGSGLAAVNLAAALIAAGEADVVAVGGTENMSKAPYLLDRARFGYRMGDATLIDSMRSEGLKDAFAGYAMGVTAENVAALGDVSREDQDAFAAESQRRCAEAVRAGRFDAELVPVEITHGNSTVSVDADETPRPGTTVEALGRLRPVFAEPGTVTAGNSSAIGDGAAAVLVLSERRARELGVEPQATWVAGAAVGVDPAHMGTGPIASTRRLLARTGLDVLDIDLVELNEAFAAQAVHVVRELGLDPARVNANGGAIALGHPLGCSGTRILVTLLHEMERRGAGLGLAALCVGGGMGVSALVRRDGPGR
ncbi:MAG: acetyl-CoA C-acetyltransferase [Bifidobacteriaceae bacterium]|jgi:acetyl-CoA C-acetyltransferase|nr:acetyl-CoA C-acetyltransferase [Bifidobacteriaceae bacterium]